jgi:hypothetical protein
MHPFTQSLFVVIYFSKDDVKGTEMKMKNGFLLLLILLAFGIFSSGCAEYSQNVKDKCPECGNVFRVDNTPSLARLARY